MKRREGISAHRFVALETNLAGFPRLDDHEAEMRQSLWNNRPGHSWEPMEGLPFDRSAFCDLFAEEYETLAERAIQKTEAV